MRSRIILFFVCFSITSSAQDYQEMVVEGATWINTYPSAGTLEDYFVYRLNGDTTLNNTNYKILYFQDFEIGDDDVLRVLSTGIPYALLREDVASRKVYSIFLDEFEFFSGLDIEDFELSRLPGEFENEYLLYDYSLEVGDVIGTEYETSVFRIDTIEVFDHTIQNFLLSPGASYYEKIGNPLTLFLPYQVFFIAGGASAVVHYCGGDTEDCEYLTQPLSNDEVFEAEIQIFPNPASTHVNLSFRGTPVRNIQLFASDGRLLHTINNISSNDIRVDLTDLDYRGVMFVTYERDFSRYTDRFIKM